MLGGKRMLKSLSGSSERKNWEDGLDTGFGGPSVPNNEAFENLGEWSKSRI